MVKGLTGARVAPVFSCGGLIANYLDVQCCAGGLVHVAFNGETLLLHIAMSTASLPCMRPSFYGLANPVWCMSVPFMFMLSSGGGG